MPKWLAIISLALSIFLSWCYKLANQETLVRLISFLYITSISGLRIFEELIEVDLLVRNHLLFFLCLQLHTLYIYACIHTHTLRFHSFLIFIVLFVHQ